MARIEPSMQTDARVIELIRLIAEMHNVIVEIDCNTRTVNFLCGKEKKEEIAKDLAIFFDKIGGEEI